MEKKTKKMLRRIPNLAEDLIMEILSRFRVKLLLQCRCVCKQWLFLLSNDKFIKLHLRRSPSHLLLQIPSSPTPFQTLLSSYLDKPTPRAQELPVQNLPPRIRVSDSSCNGLFLLSNENGTFTSLLNPSTREYVVLPMFGPLLERYYFSELVFGRNTTLGFGYDAGADKYKVVVIASVCDEFDGKSLEDVSRNMNNYTMSRNVCRNMDNYVLSRKTEVRVFTLGTGSWRRVNVAPVKPFLTNDLFGKHVDGVLYCKSVSYRIPIVTFDLRSEKFGEIPCPNLGEVDVKNYSIFSLEVVDGCLCALGSQTDSECVDIWLLKDSWVRVYSIGLPILDYTGMYKFALLAIRKNGEMLVQLQSELNGEMLVQLQSAQLAFYDPITKVVRAVSIHGDPNIFWTFIYEESLTSIASLMAGE